RCHGHTQPPNPVQSQSATNQLPAGPLVEMELDRVAIDLPGDCARSAADAPSRLRAPGGSAQDAQSASAFGTGQLTEQPAANGRSDQQRGQSPALLRRGDEARQRQLAELEACPDAASTSQSKQQPAPGP